MGKSFYHYIVKFRTAKAKDDISQFANDIYLDHSFPIYSKDYNELSSYLELNGQYLKSMSIFDKAWDLYENED
ncbi:YozE family protein [Fredinandcohnia onubensis]|uniref:YozE family protein n=1 Tax=Fredinandcohnia onubensis TaxID=1571209 RepID=UPI000C0BE28E|nr:YozE family protein [Fredinandcohnia onubensis]